MKAVRRQGLPGHLTRRTGRGVSTLSIAGALGAILVLAQVAIMPTLPNGISALIAAACTAVTLAYCFRDNLLERHPLSTLAILGYCVTTQGLALVVQTLSLMPLTFNLENPLDTFTIITITQIVIVTTHLMYLQFSLLRAPGDLIGRHVLTRLNIFRSPSDIELWALGFVGVAATVVSKIILAGDIEYGDVGGKFLQALGSFIIAPMFIPFRGLFLNRTHKLAAHTTPALVGYFGIVMIIALAMNSRGVFANIFLGIVLALLVSIVTGRLVLSSTTRLYVLLGTVAAIPLMSAATDLATAMVMARNLRSDISTSQLISETISAFGDKAALAEARAGEVSQLSGTFYSEFYISNPFIQRLTYTKYTDVVMTASLRLSDGGRAAVVESFKTGLLSSIPTPVLRLFGSQLDKSQGNFSTGDLYDSLAFGTDPAGFKTGSSVVNARDIFGALWIPALFIVFLAVFNIYDSLAYKTAAGVIISPYAFMVLATIFTRSLVADSFRAIVDPLFRGFWQGILIYAAIILVIRIFIGLLPRSGPVPINAR